MKKRWLSLLMLICFGLCFIGGCKDNENGTVSKLKDVNGNDVVLKIGDKQYTANELFADMLNDQTGAQTVYEKILKTVVENSVPVDSNMEASWELMLESFEENVESTSLSSGISEEEARAQLLAEEGYSSIEEKKEAYYYSVKLDKIQNDYWNDNKMDFYNEYFNSNLPYYVKHVLVKTPYTSARGPYSTIIESSDAKALYNVYDWLVKGRDFSQIMNEYSEDTGSKDTGLGYHMDLTTSFVPEFLYGVYIFDALLRGTTGELTNTGITKAAELYKSLAAANVVDKGFNFGVINASDIEVLGDKASDSDIKSITMYENVLKEGSTTEYEEKNAGTISSAYGSSYSLYTRSIVFNQTFNNPGISVIQYDVNRDGVTAPTKTININGKNIDVLTDENGNIVFVVCARGSSSDLWIHFLTVNVSPFDTYENTNGEKDARIFYSIDKEVTIQEMVDEYIADLKTAGGKTDDEIATLANEYKTNLGKMRTYVDEKVKNNDTLSNRNNVIDELEGYVKSYAKRGITSGAVAGEEQYLTYAMLKSYMEKEDSKVVIENATIKTIVTNYLTEQINLIELNKTNYIMNGWDEYYELVTLAQSEEIVDRKIPMECSYSVNGNSNRGSLCKYVYGKGFEILMRYMDGTTELTVDDKYKSYMIGDADFVLPTPTKENYDFAGWYEDADLTIEATLDTMRTSTSNKTQLYAKWEPKAPQQSGSGN